MTFRDVSTFRDLSTFWVVHLYLSSVSFTFGSFTFWVFHLWDLSPFGIFHLPGAATDTTKQVPFIMSAECVFKRSGRAPTVDPLTGEVRQGDTIAGKLPL